MPDRLASSDAALLRQDAAGTPGHVATVLVLDPVDGQPVDLDLLAGHVAGRIAYVPRYRQRLRPVPFGLDEPMWVDDARFDVAYHVRRSALPRPGGDAELREFVARVTARPLDRTRPLWEVYLVDGLDGGAVAVVTKTHQVLVDGVRAVDLAQVLLDDAPGTTPAPAHAWVPSAPPGAADLVAGAVLHAVAEPAGAARTIALNALSGNRRLVAPAIAVAAAVQRAGDRRGQRPGPLTARVSPHRRFGTCRTRLSDYQMVAKLVRAEGGEPGRRRPSDAATVHDVVLAVVAGALRSWLLQRRGGLSVQVLRAAVPISLTRVVSAGSAGSVDVSVVELPVGEPNPVLRLHHIAFQVGEQLRGEREAGSASVPARELADLAGFAPATLHGLGTRVAARLSRRGADLVVTNVPGPQRARYAAGARLRATYPVLPLPPGHAVAIGVTSYDGHVFHGFTGDWDAAADLGGLADAVPEALGDLVEALS